MDSNLPSIAIVGAGAVGCYYGGLFAKAGFPVIMIARDNQIESLTNQGVGIQWEERIEYFQVNASSNYEALTNASYVLIAVKTQGTLQTASQIAPHLKSNAIVLSLQNGLDNAGLLKKHIQQPCYSALIYAAIAMIDLNLVKHLGGGNLIIGNTIPEQSEQRLEFLSQLLQLAQIPTKVSKTIIVEMWHKLIINCVLNGLSAIAQINYSELLKSPRITEVIDLIQQECCQIALLEGVHLDQEHIKDLVSKVPNNWPMQISSTAQDLSKSKATEIDYLNGAIVAKAKKHGAVVPINEMIYSLIKMREYQQGTFNPSSLVQLV
jgi:2-dehydropantoate 2-reductase